nr:hypothetical protein [Bradyrhizobium neotropicale]
MAGPLALANEIAQQRHLRILSIFCLIENDGPCTSQDITADFLTWVSRKTVHDERMAGSAHNEFPVDLIPGKGMESSVALSFHTHRYPSIRAYDVGVSDCLNGTCRWLPVLSSLCERVCRQFGALYKMALEREADFQHPSIAIARANDL